MRSRVTTLTLLGVLASTAGDLASQLIWTPAQTSGSRPAARTDAALVYDSIRGRVVLFGGMQSSNLTQFGDTWEWDGSTWTQVASAGPPIRSQHAMAFDAARGRTVLFGGWDRLASTGGPVVQFADTWEWDGASWRQIQVAGPSARANMVMAYDPVRRRTVLFGGNGDSAALGDTWEWDGATWSQRGAGTGPSPAARTNSAMTYADHFGGCVLVGGDPNQPTEFGDLWLWNGTSWRLLGFGPPRSRHEIAWHPLRQRLVLRGGYVETGAPNQTWEWDGRHWLRHPDAAPFLSAHLVYDAARDQLLHFGGLQVGSGSTSALYALQPTVAASSAIAGAGCGPAGRVPTLTTNRPPLLGTEDFRLEVGGATPFRLVLAVLAARTGTGQNWGPCTVVPDLAASIQLVGASTGSGVASLEFPLPNDPVLRGLSLYHQAVVLDNGGALLGLADLSNALNTVLGD